MTPGPTIIKKCSSCARMVGEPTVASGNTFGSTVWTDGRRVSPMLPDPLWLGMCPHCQGALWMDELQVLGQVEPWESATGPFEDACDVVAPSQVDYLRALPGIASVPKKERFLRVRAWWAGNDRRRSDAGNPPMERDELENLDELAAALDEGNGEELVLKAEAMRELGRFDQALRLLEGSRDARLVQVVATIRRLAESRDSLVREVAFEVPVGRSR